MVHKDAGDCVVAAGQTSNAGCADQRRGIQIWQDMHNGWKNDNKVLHATFEDVQ